MPEVVVPLPEEVVFEEQSPPVASGDGVALCPNCEAASTGRYCEACGQYQFRSRLTLKRLWVEFASRVFNLNRGLLATIVEMSRHPGRVPLEYVEGKRRRYTNPLTYLFIACAVSLFMLQFSEDQLREQMAAGFATQEASREGEAETTAVPHDHDGDGIRDHDPTEEELRVERVREGLDAMMANGGALYMERLMVNMRKYQTPLMLLLCIPFALFLRILFGPVRNLAEISVFSLYIVSHSILILAFLMLVLVRLGIIATMLGTLVYLVLAAWGAVRFWGEGWSAAARSTAAMTLAQMAYTVVVMIFAVVVTFGSVFSEAGASWGWFLGRVVRGLFS